MQNWSYLLDLKTKYPSISNCNSLVIADRYLLSDKYYDPFETNIRPILDAILPNRLDNNIIFTICVIAQNICISIEDRLSDLDLIIQELRPRLNYKLTIYDSRRLHDRSILTNNIILTSGAGFDVIGGDEKPMKFTTTSLSFPFLQLSANDSNIYLDWINNILEEKGRCRYYKQDYWGDRATKHHLLDYYYERPARVSRTNPSSRWSGFNPREGSFTPRRVS